ncbi:hypothetical protein H2200_001676 [Cladophialophora chaetospira]|uniref:Monooxygenase n=1 Tax=Cladophialophora chaetospira TaxID=386627 RepID=A0AA38XLG6_9EURO|nr:hypothetical protein H2200_001676 [Cladophialophora chaetospira]
MPLIEIAALRLQPSFSSNVPESFASTWVHACHQATKAANGVPFQLYQNPADKDLYYLFGGWKTGQDHINFLSTPDAVTLAKSIGQYMTVDTVRHIDGDVDILDGAAGRPKKLRVEAYKVPTNMALDWEANWNAHQGGSGGWDLSGEVQQQHKAFKWLRRPIAIKLLAAKTKLVAGLGSG